MLPWEFALCCQSMYLPMSGEGLLFLWLDPTHVTQGKFVQVLTQVTYQTDKESNLPRLSHTYITLGMLCEAILYSLRHQQRNLPSLAYTLLKSLTGAYLST